MRIIGGSARGRRLAAPPGMALRPTPDRVREALFNILAMEIAGTVFLDLYAGTGAIGLEALSRGAARVVMVDRDRRHAAILRANLQHSGLQGGELLECPALAALEQLGRRRDRFEVVFLDPPYDDAAEREACLRQIVQGDLLSEGARVVVELPRQASPPEVPGLDLERLARYGDTSLAFYRAARPPHGG